MTQDPEQTAADEGPEFEADVFATKRRSENALAGWTAEGGAIEEGPALDPEASEAFPPADG